MTRFRRSSHYRTSRYGYTYLVSEHDVDRYDWERSSRVRGKRSRSQLAALRAYSGTTAAFVNPNAKCPVCGASVFYYQNEHGSKVFFDELGPPWPKHPCENNSLYESGRTNIDGLGPSAPVVRAAGERELIDRYRRDLSIDRRRDFRSLYGSAPPTGARVLKRLRAGRIALLILASLSGEPATVFLHCQKLPRSVGEGTIVFLAKSRLSFFDSSTMQPKDVPIKRVRGAGSFVKLWLTGGEP